MISRTRPRAALATLALANVPMLGLIANSRQPKRRPSPHCTAFDRTDGYPPLLSYTPLVQATNGVLVYGTRGRAGQTGLAPIFEITPSGTAVATLSNFCSQGGLTRDRRKTWHRLIKATDEETSTGHDRQAKASSYGHSIQSRPQVGAADHLQHRLPSAQTSEFPVSLVQATNSEPLRDSVRRRPQRR